jgi:hypothetical protein
MVWENALTHGHYEKFRDRKEYSDMVLMHVETHTPIHSVSGNVQFSFDQQV